LRNPASRRLWIATVISGTCIAAHDSAATWMMNIFIELPFSISLMSTVASLPFFLFTVPAGASGCFQVGEYVSNGSMVPRLLRKKAPKKKRSPPGRKNS
jgi:Transmembrane secretion effector